MSAAEVKESALEHDVIVVGAGPGGSAAAYHLARRGRRVLLLDRRAFPRDKSCGDGLTRPAVRLLDEMGVLPRLGDRRRVRGARTFIKGKGSRDFLFPDGGSGLVVPRLELDHAVCQRAVEVGAELREGFMATKLIRENGVVCGVEATDGPQRIELRAPVVIAADGANSRLARDAGLTAVGDEEAVGFAIRGYYEGLAGLDDLLEIYLPLLDPTDRYLLPSYGWVFPTGPTTANIGVGLFYRQHDEGVNVRALMEQFIQVLEDTDPRFAAAQPVRPWKGAPLRFDFSPDGCSAPGLLLVGDAAGLVSPFTGEGISFALQSGRLAAEVIDQALVKGGDELDLSDYRRRLGQMHTGYFEMGRASARRYVFLWHVLESTFRNEKPLFTLAREAFIFPESMGETYLFSMLDDVRDRMGSLAPLLRADLVAAGEILSETVRRDWPFLAGFVDANQSDPGVPFRPALLLLLAAQLGSSPKPQAPALAAAVELGYLATLAQLSVIDDPVEKGDGARPANWGNMFAVMVGDFLLGKAYELSARMGAGVSKVIAHSLATACEGRVRESRRAHDADMTLEEHLAVVTSKTATLFELPCLLGARLSGLTVQQTAALSEYGRQLGIAFQLAEDLQGLEGKSGPFSLTTQTDLEEGMYPMPVRLALRRPHWDATELRSLLRRPSMDDEARRRIHALVKESGAVEETLRLVAVHAAKATIALDDVPPSHARAALASLAEYVGTGRPVHPSRPARSTT